MSQLNARNTAAPKGEKQLPIWIDFLVVGAFLVLMLELWGFVNALFRADAPVLTITGFCVLAATLALLGLLARRTWAWIGVLWAMLGILALVTALHGSAAVVLFRNRAAFGVEPRRGWTMLVRQGWPFWLMTGGLQVAALIQAVNTVRADPCFR